MARGRLAIDIVTARLQLTGVKVDELRCDLIGLNAMQGGAGLRLQGEPQEVRVRIAGRAAGADDAAHIGNEVEALYTNGPAGGAGATRSVRDVLAVGSTFLPRHQVHCRVDIEEA